MFTEAHLLPYSEVSHSLSLIHHNHYHHPYRPSIDVPASAFYFGTYEGMLRQLTPKGQRSDRFNPCDTWGTALSLSPAPPPLSLCSRDQVGAGYVLLAGGTAGITNWTSCIAQDTVKSRFQTAPSGKYSGLSQVFMEIVSPLDRLLYT